MDLVTYALSKKYADKRFEDAASISFNTEYKAVEDLPIPGESNVIYLIPIVIETGESYCEEFVYTDNGYEVIGTTQINIEGDVSTETVAPVVQDVISEFIISGGGATVE